MRCRTTSAIMSPQDRLSLHPINRQLVLRDTPMVPIDVSDDSPSASPARGPRDRIVVLDPRGQLRRAAVGFTGCSMLSYERAVWALRSWLDSWAGIGLDFFTREVAYVAGSSSGLRPLRVCCCPTSST